MATLDDGTVEGVYECYDGQDPHAPPQHPEIGIHEDVPLPLVVPPVVPPEVYQEVGEIWLLQRFKDSSPFVFKGSVGVKGTDDWLQEMEKNFMILQCSDREKVLLAEFSLKSSAQVL